MSYPAMPPPPVSTAEPTPPPPAALRPVVVLLLVNLGLSILLTVLVLALKNSVIDYQLDHRHITDPHQRQIVRDSYSAGIIGRVIGNIVVSVLYVFLVRALWRGKRWAYRRVIIVGVAGIAALGLLWLTPYPAWMRVEQTVQALVLAVMVYFVTRPAVREHFPRVPGASRRRFGLR